MIDVLTQNSQTLNVTEAGSFRQVRARSLMEPLTAPGISSLLDMSAGYRAWEGPKCLKCLKKGMEATVLQRSAKAFGRKIFFGDKPWQTQGLGNWIYTNDQCLWPLVDWSNQKYVIQSMCIFWPCKKTTHFLLYRFRSIAPALNLGAHPDLHWTEVVVA